MDLLTLLSLAGMNRINSGNDIYRIEIANDPEDQIIELEPESESEDDEVTDELNDFLRLAGQSTECDICDTDPCSCSEVDEAQANYDYGKNPTQKMGHESDPEIYKIRGKDNLNVRYTPARSGDNPLTGEYGTSSVKETKNFLDYLKEVEEK